MIFCTYKETTVIISAAKTNSQIRNVKKILYKANKEL